MLCWVAARFSGFRVAVLGDMLELGEDEMRYHAEVGRSVAEQGFDLLVTVGERARHMAAGARAAGLVDHKVISFATAEEAGTFLRDTWGRGSTVLFKASRGVGLERAIEVLRGKD